MGKADATILLADDDAFVREMMAMILEAEGYGVEIAENGKEALSKYHDHRNFSLVITDMQMPEMDGMELIAAIREKNQDIPVILLSGNEGHPPGPEDQAANLYLTKDESIQERILEAVDSLLARSVSPG